VKRRIVRTAVGLGAILVAALLVTLVINSLHWIGKPFPGFFVMDNRVVPSIALPDWPNPAAIFQTEVVAVGTTPVASSDEVYEQVALYPVNTPLLYTVREPQGSVRVAMFRSRTFTRSDYMFLFGSLLVTGTAFIAAGLLVFWLKPGSSPSLALLSCGLATGLFGITAVDLYDPHWFFRLHIIGEAMLAPGFMHLALVFPRDRLRRYRRTLLAGIYLPFVALAVVYQAVLTNPAAYTTVHFIATAAQAVSGIMIIAAVAYDLFTTKSPLVRRRLAVVGLGTVSGFVVPAVLMAGSGIFGGTIAVNGAALTAFFFPIALGYAIVKQDVFEIDVMLRRAATYGVVVMTIAAAYFLTLYVMGVLVPGQFSSWSPVALAALNFGLLFLIASLREHVQETIDRVFYRQKYRVDQALSTLSSSLASARAVGELVSHTQQVFADTLTPRHTSVFLHSEGQRFVETGGESRILEREVIVAGEIAERFERTGVLACYEWDDGSGRRAPAIWAKLDAEVLVPLRTNGVIIGLLALGRKSSGHAYSVHDIAFLRTAANQISLALTNALAFGQLEELNFSLERKVRERTSALRAANTELNGSLDKLREAYGQLEQSQASLLRADRLATLGRLTAGIAHEMNTPLSAVLNALKILSELGQEYSSSVEDPDVLPQDHREIAGEIVTTAQAASSWAQKAASYINSVKAHGREPRSAAPSRILVSAVVTETQALLSHRLRTAACRLDLEEATPGAVIVGDPGRLSQILLNLCTNAIDAYEDFGMTGGRILVELRQTAEVVTATVTDWAGGIAAHVLPHIFDELYTTKGAGRGTGLGLWIARNLVEQAFGGTLSVDTTAGVGSTFTLVFPVRDEALVVGPDASRLPVAATPLRANASLH
jgi:signal transduction histidine kinase